ncbi:MAG: transporter, family, glycerol-3-phosphate transporter [Phycisphaerales bacterium]|nr:transporter, family, glycerol-3-phosphate transporter [Phycisphaerales bacterium]
MSESDTNAPGGQKAAPPAVPATPIDPSASSSAAAATATAAAVDYRSAATPEIPPHPPGFRLRRGRNWFCLGLLYAGYYLCRYNLGIVAPELKEEFKLNNAQYGMISTGRDGGYAVGQFINGLFADGLGGKQAMAVGAIGTILLNFVFGFASMTTLAVSTMLIAFIVIRLLDGYMQAFGAPGMVKINTSWFQRRERGRFAGIFGGMIQLGAIGVGKLGGYLLIGFTIPIIGMTIAKQNWRSMFFVPPAILFVILIIMWMNVKNHPEEAGYTIPHDDDEHGAGNINEKLPLAYVFKKIAGNAIAWINAGAYFCTGFVRRAVESWWVLYLVSAWAAGKDSGAYKFLVWSLPISAFVGSFSSGLLSDTLFKGKRAPVAALLYWIETVVIVISFIVLGHTNLAGTVSTCVLLTAISLTCNSTHSIIGTAAAMDLGGRKMAGFASGVIDSFQYFGAIFAGFFLGGLIDKHGWNALFYAMAPFSAAGAMLMTWIWLTTRGRDVKGS